MSGIGAQLTLSESRLSDGFAPIPAIRVTATELVISTLSSRSPTLVRLTRHGSEAAIPVEPI